MREQMVKSYELIREIFNSCSGNVRDVDISEIQTDDIEAVVKQFLNGENVRYERYVKNKQTVIFDIDADGLRQRLTFTENA
jgi:CRISPR/Cas system-associated protein endoribonuclease Cas2